MILNLMKITFSASIVYCTPRKSRCRAFLGQSVVIVTMRGVGFVMTLTMTALFI